ncbi:MAG: tyrosine-type recombinase/integrase [Magnetococcales bacterium]|nr:tyrosine-type recombinase/integrase [Magnetococcales bacterium]
MKFSDRYIQSLKPKEQRYEVLEGLGFSVRVTPTGSKTFFMAYQFEGRNRRLTLGSYPEMKLTEARKKHADARQMLAKGVDPGALEQDAKREAHAAPTIAQLVTEYLEKWAKPRKRAWREDERVLNRDVVPRWGRRKAHAITRRDVIALLDEIMERDAPIMANKTLAIIRKMFNFAIGRSILETSPCLAIPAPAPTAQRDRVLSEEEIRTVWNGLDHANMDEGTKLAVKFQILTAQRKGEVVAAKWDEVDCVNGWWTMPLVKVKNKLTHRVPLSKEALALLEEIKALAGDSQWLFPSGQTANHIIATSVDHAVRKNLPVFGIDRFTPHDLRRSAATHMTSMGISRLTVGKILNHAEPGVTAVYDRHSYDAEKRIALDAWGRKLETIVTGQPESNVLPLHRAS